MSGESGASSDEKLPRRTFLVRMGTTVAAVGLVIGCDDDEGASEASGPISAGNVSGVAVGSVAAVGGKPVILGRDTGGLYALSAICTHEQCDISHEGTIAASGIHCNCHGSQFSATGAVIKGPATSPLKHYKVDLGADGSITIQAGTVVDAATRTAVG